MTVYTEAHHVLREEALRMVPGFLSARDRGDISGAQVLMHSFMNGAAERGVSGNDAWTILFTAAMHWTDALAKQVAKHRDVDYAEVLHNMAFTAARFGDDGG